MASSTGGSELFSSYEQDFTSVTDSIKLKIEQQIPNQKGGKYNNFNLCDIHTLFILYSQNRGKKGNNSCCRKRSR